MIELTKNAIDEAQTRGQGIHPRNNAALLTSGIKLSILTEVCQRNTTKDACSGTKSDKAKKKASPSDTITMPKRLFYPKSNGKI